MNRFVRKKSNHLKRSLFITGLIFVLVMTAFFMGINAAMKQNQDGARTVLEQAVNRSMTECYAIEGRYPESLKYMEENYGLYYDKDEYLVDYRVIGSNVKPRVTIIERRGSHEKK